MGWDIRETFFFFLYENICCGYSLEAPQQGTSNEYPQHTFLWHQKQYTVTSPSPQPLSPPHPPKGRVCVFLVLISLALVGNFLVCTISCEPVVGFLPNFYGDINGT